MLKIRTIAAGPLGANCYLVVEPESNRGIIIDPAAEREKLLKAVERSGATFQAVVNTHGHFDHIGADGIKKDLGIPLLIHQLDAPLLKEAARDQLRLLGFGPTEPTPPPDRFLTEGDEISLGTETLTVWHTPGHTRGGICLVGQGVVFSGDTLFQDGVGRTDLEGGDDAQLEQSLRRILALPEETVVYPGHGPSTTVAAEKGNY